MDTGDTAWVLTSAALVLLMTPGLAFFYGGMVRAKSVLNMMMMSFGAIAVVATLWVLYGYSVAFGDDVGYGLVGNPAEYAGLSSLIGEDAASGTTPATAFVAFQAMFAILTVALISGAVADRVRFGPWLLFAGLWATLVYFPVAHWVFAFDEDGVVGGWIANDLAALDFAGGTAVHINSGAAALALAIVIGKRRGWPRESMKPHNLPFVMLGAGLLFFGWFGFNAGSALAADSTAAVAFINTLAATATAMLGWLLIERIRDGKPTTLGGASGVVAGLVGITPAANAVTPVGALLLGLIVGAICSLAVSIKYKAGYDDSLDVVAIHLVGGLVGTLLIGLIGSALSPAGVDGLLYGGGVDQLWRQAIGAGAVLAYSFVVTMLIAGIIKGTVGFRPDPDDETRGIDEAEHAESAYEFSSREGSATSSQRSAASLGATTTKERAEL